MERGGGSPAVYDLEIWRRKIGKGPVPKGESYYNVDIGNGLFREMHVLQKENRSRNSSVSS